MPTRRRPACCRGNDLVPGLAPTALRRRSAGFRFKIARGFGDEFLAAAVAAEEIGRARVLGLVLGLREIDRHAANGISRLALQQRRLERGRYRRGRCVRMMCVR